MKLLKILSMTAAAVMITVSASATNIYDLATETPIANNVIQKNIKRLTDKGWQNINIIEADLSDGSYTVKALTDTEDLTKLSTVKDLATKNNTLAAINGDFFSWKWDDKTRGSAVGGVIIDGTTYSSITSPWNFSTVAQNKYGTFIFDYFDHKIEVKAPNEYVIAIEHINKYDDLTTPIIYTKEWGPLSPGSSGFQAEIVVEDDIITSINYDAGPVPFPENGYIISFLSDHSPEIRDNFFVGDEIELSISYEPAFEDIEFAIGAGTLLLKDGKKAENTNDIAGYQPRTAIGVSKDNSKIYLVTVDGRSSASRGVTLDYLSDIMAEIGAYHAANLDGGGSTTMIVKSPYTNGQELANSPSDKYLRPVANGIGIIPLTAADKNGFITIETDCDYVFSGTKILLNAKVHDSLGNILDVNDLKWKCTNGNIEDGYYIPEDTGSQTVTVSYGGMTQSKQITVLENPVKLMTGLKEYKIKSGESAYISLTAQDKKGYRAYLNLDDVDITLSSSILDVDGNKLTAKKKGTAIATFNFGDVQTSAIIRVDGDTSSVKIPEDIEKSAISKINDGFTMAVFGDTATKNTLTERLVVNKLVNNLKTEDYNLAIFAGTISNIPEKTDFDILTTKAFSAGNYDDTSIIALNGSDFLQWKKLTDKLKNISSKNLFIVISDSINDDAAYMEEMLIDIVEKELYDTNVYIISANGESIERDSGITHIKIPGTEAIKGASTATDDAHYYKITVDGDKFNCEKIKIYE